MAFELTDEQRLAQRAIRHWCERELAPAVPALERGEPPYPLMRRLAAAFGLRELADATLARLEQRGEAPGDGGAVAAGGADAALSMVLMVELSRVSPGFCLALGASIGLAAGAILKKGTPAQRRRFGLPLLRLDQIGAWAMTEPGAGSDAFSGLRTSARRDGDGYLLSGQKTFITNAPDADVLVIYAKLDDPADPTPLAERPIHAFLVERGTPGLALSRPMEKMGMHASPTGEVFLDGVRVPRAQLLGEREEEPARERARDVFHGERTALPAMALGIIERCLDEALRYARERTTWGRPIGEQQLVQEKLARMYVHRENVRNQLFKHLWLTQQGRRMTMAEASACKLYAARAATEVALEAVQILGGHGYLRESRVEMFARDAKLLQIGGGTDEIQILTIARALLRER